MKQIWARLKSFFFPPPGAPRAARVLPYTVLGLLTLVALVGGAYGWDYTNSPEFCGTACHTMPPEYTTYLTSPHARIACVECHIGRDFIATQISRKAGDLRHVVYTVFKRYEFPITAEQMRPARDSCERCHFPEKFSDDSLRQIKHYGNDKENIPFTIYLILKTGGGSTRLGLGRGIHWHVENKIYYYPADVEEQIIPYIKVTYDDGSVDEYIDIESGFNPNEIDEEELEEMDCITCHNRITHLVNTPERSLDVALERKLIDSGIPEIRLKGVEVMRASYASNEQALNGIAGLEGYYKTVYPEYYAANTEKIQAAIATIQDIYSQSVHIEQKSDWNSHPNNIGHDDSPGCFRCHGGKHLNDEQEAIRLECNLCHSIPVVVDSYDFVADIEISRGPEPQSHLNPNWIALHRNIFDNTCTNCHSTEDPGGISNTSFCSNSACHGSVWEFAGFDAPALREILQAQLPPPPESGISLEGPLTYVDTIGPLMETRCTSCHGTTAVAGLDLSSYRATMTGSTSGAVVIPGDPGGSLLIQKQTGEQSHFGQFTPDELGIVMQWIQEGAPEE